METRPPQVKLFTVEDARKALPLVKVIVRDIVTQAQKLNALQHNKAERPVDQKFQDRAEDLKGQIVELMSELQELGVELKGSEEGLVDFYTERDGRLAYLCWKLGEESIEWWHDLESGFAGRQRLA